MWIKWQSWYENGLVEHGEMPLKEVNKSLLLYAKTASGMLERTGADHILYAIKYYNKKTGELELIRFYMKPMSDEAFERVAMMRNVVVYALHKHS